MCRNIALSESPRDTLIRMRIAFVGGGSGGHFYPLIAVAGEIRKNSAHPELYYFGPSPYDEAALAQFEIEYIYCPAGKLRRYFSVQNIIDVFRNFFGVFVAIIRLYEIYPDVVFSKGGFTSVPVLTAAKLLAIPIVIHESDAVPGRANRLAVRKARYIGIAYDDVAQYFPPEKTALVGIPLRPEITAVTTNPFEVLGIPNDKPLIYVTGGSLGAERINSVITRSLGQLLPHYRIFHQTGTDNIEDLRLTAKSLLDGTGLEDSYYLEGKIDAPTVSALYSAAALVITRAGSTTLFEIAYHSKPSIVVPIPEDVSRDQRTNAYAYARTGAATVLEEQNLTQGLLIQEINSIITDSNRYAAMSQAAHSVYIPGAAKSISDILISIGHEHGS